MTTEEKDQHERFMREALGEAEKAYALGEVPVGAVAVLNGEIIGRGHNLRETLKDATAHAEILALREAAKKIGDWRLEEVTLYTTLEPCPMCAGALIQFRVKRVVFGAFDPKAGAAGSVVDLLRDPRFNHQVEVVGGVLAEESGALLRRFFQELRAERRDGRVD
ncbi:tRNA adenosine(34) deaminase TadA [Ammonifex thiophilus]|uniref:tRNA-specific adenosine deaminase n=1 Tax=Ammonifex thiophilus TaxID=444093 RepID=A0A3D8P5K1_9THEO|nr:tRNA adenosine(34) deaminase TadA [Ammonifex thiophilus]RDV84596.1 tRNA adenosine(34) deaminase TadA [Ammonifex thiophilus]